MQHLGVSCAVRPILWPLDVKWLIHCFYFFLLEVNLLIFVASCQL